MKEVREQQQQQGLYRSEFEHDNCGIGAVVNIKGKKTHDTVANALKIVEHLEHRAGKDAEGKTGDGVGILLQISHKFFKKACKNSSAASDVYKRQAWTQGKRMYAMYYAGIYQKAGRCGKRSSI